MTADDVRLTGPVPPAGMRGNLGPLFRLVRDQRVAFLLVGGTNTLIGAISFIAFQALLQEHLGYMVVLLCSHVTSVLCAFVLYRRFVFRVQGHVWRDLGRFEVINLGNLVFNLAMLPLLVEVAGLPVLASQLMIAAVTVVFSWFGHRGFSFRRGPEAVVDPAAEVPERPTPAGPAPSDADTRADPPATG